jgi:regulator of nonsense transcripts 2
VSSLLIILRFSSPLVASIVSGLSSYNDTIGIRIVDHLLEEVRFLLEENDFKLHQRQVMNIKFLGELYNYCMVESQIIFDTLYTLILLGHEQPSPSSLSSSSSSSLSSALAAAAGLWTVPSTVDPVTDCFRVRLVCTLLDTCGQYFDRGSSKKVGGRTDSPSVTLPSLWFLSLT